MIKSALARLYKDEQGASAVEYSVFVAFFALTLIVGLEIMGVSLGSFFTGSAGYVETKTPS